mmetsp:Transcript_1441/g.2304  ORF Transcript_1441/g.2304 Transcript_1441/m.2304 type:complete len:86 (-) Transcript_1441:89-346(-)
MRKTTTAASTLPKMRPRQKKTPPGTPQVTTINATASTEENAEEMDEKEEALNAVFAGESWNVGSRSFGRACRISWLLMQHSSGGV